MDYGKYIIKEVRGHEVAILFHPLISHCDIETRGDSRGKNVAAGFFSVAGVYEDSECNILVDCWGKSDTLKLKSRGVEDEAIINKMLRPT